MKNFNYSFIDFHTHILPRADHGSDSLQTSIQQTNMAHSIGVNKIIATPHFYPHKHTVDAFLERRASAYKNLVSAKEFNKDVQIKLAAEVLLCDNIHMLDGIDNLYCIGRNGQHRYNNMDHSMMTAFEAVRALKNGARSRDAIWNVNTEKEYHEEKKEN